jgi:FtsH-binding integral membrane protein
MTGKNLSPEIQQQLQRFWGRVAFALGILWGFANLIYVPVVVLTTLRGGSVAEVILIACGGMLLFWSSIRAFFHRKGASLVLLVGGVFFLAVGLLLPLLPVAHTTGLDHRILVLAAAVAALALAGFGLVTERLGWPPLRDSATYG